MYLKKLEIQGFKSFAYKTTLEFNPGITCIVGPNGSGKSNVADAVRWVMGEQSLKVLRGKKLEDVIFSGSVRKTRLGAAEVSLFIDNKDQVMPIDYPEVIITRRVYRNGESEYLINKKLVRLQDILLLLARSNFGQRTYSVIAQGMIDYFIMSSPRERKELFDEAAGVRQFQIKRDQAVLKLERTKENLGQAEILLQEIAPRLRSLTRQVKRWERREEIEGKLRDKQVEHYNFLYQDIFEKHERTQKSFFEKEKEVLRIKSELEELQSKLDGLEKESSRAEVFKNLQKEYQKILDEKNSLIQEQSVLEGEIEVDALNKGDFDLNFLVKKKEEQTIRILEYRRNLDEVKKKLAGKEKIFEEKIGHQKKILEQYDKIEQQLKIYKEKMEIKEPLDFSEIKNELNQIYILHQDFIKKIVEVKELENLKIIKREAEKIKDRVRVFLERIKKSSSPAISLEIIELQNSLNVQIKNRDRLINEINDIKIDIRVNKEREDNLKKLLLETESENEKIERQIERLKSGPREEREERLVIQKEELNRKINSINESLNNAQKKIDLFNEDEQKKKDRLFDLQRDFRERQGQYNKTSNKMNDIKVELVRFETKKEDIEHEVKEELPENFWMIVFNEKRETNEIIPEERENEILRLKHQIELIGGIDENTQREYRETKERYDFLKNQTDDLQKAIKDLEKAIDDLDKTIESKFNSSFEKISQEYAKYFRILFNGGNAKLSLIREELYEETEEQLEEGQVNEGEKEVQKNEKKFLGKVITGVEIKATPPGKKLKNINMLSGGERALSSIALICAILSSNPSPFVVLDEVDAALDEANSIKFSKILGDLSKKSQFIVITHNRTTMEKAKILYGITMGDDGVSKMLSVKMEEAEKVIKAHGNR